MAKLSSKSLEIISKRQTINTYTVSGVKLLQRNSKRCGLQSQDRGGIAAAFSEVVQSPEVVAFN